MRHGGREQVLRPDALYVDSDATLFRGTLYQRDKTKSHAVVIADVNGDARKDVSLGTGRMGGYGSPSYDVFVYDAGTDSAVRSQPFSALTPGGSGLFQLDDVKLRLQAKSGCCIHSVALYAVQKDIPVLTERIAEDAVAAWIRGDEGRFGEESMAPCKNLRSYRKT